MPRKKPEQLKSKAAPAPAAKEQPVVSAPVAAPIAPVPVPQNTGYHPADINGDGHIDAEEKQMELEFRRKALEDADAMRDAQRNMTWFALFGLLLYPFAVVGASLAGLDEAQKTLGNMAPTYFVAVAGIVAAFFGAQAYTKKK
jgi:hypothetical protein